MKLDAAAVAKAAGTKAADSGGLGQIERVIKGVNEIFSNYWRLQGKAPPEQAAPGAEAPQKIGFSAAREQKKIEMAGGKAEVDTGAKGATMAENNEFKALLTGLIKAARTMEAMGSGEKAIGEAILEMPISVSQTRAFLEKLYASKYGGSQA